MSNSSLPAPVSTSHAPAPIGPYSQGITVGNLLFVSGQLPVEPGTGEFVPGDIEERAHQCLKNLKTIAEAAGTGFDRAVKLTFFLTDLGNFARVNGVYAQYLDKTLPARSTIQVAGLPKNADIEIEAIFSL